MQQQQEHPGQVKTTSPCGPATARPTLGTRARFASHTFFIFFFLLFLISSYFKVFGIVSSGVYIQTYTATVRWSHDQVINLVTLTRLPGQKCKPLNQSTLMQQRIHRWCLHVVKFSKKKYQTLSTGRLKGRRAVLRQRRCNVLQHRRAEDKRGGEDCLIATHPTRPLTHQRIYSHHPPPPPFFFRPFTSVPMFPHTQTKQKHNISDPKRVSSIRWVRSKKAKKEEEEKSIFLSLRKGGVGGTGRGTLFFLSSKTKQKTEK